MSDETVLIARLERENAYLKLRCAQLQDDVTSLSAQVTRMTQDHERNYVRRSTPVAARDEA